MLFISMNCTSLLSVLCNELADSVCKASIAGVTINGIPKPYGNLFDASTNTTGVFRVTNLEWKKNEVWIGCGPGVGRGKYGTPKAHSMNDLLSGVEPTPH